MANAESVSLEELVVCALKDQEFTARDVVEAALFRHPAIAEAAIIGVPDERLGEAVMAVIALKPGAKVNEEDLGLHCRNSLGGFKVPRRFAFVETLPKSALGKVLKGRLRDQFSR